jgi:hypothetical protein
LIRSTALGVNRPGVLLRITRTPTISAPRIRGAANTAWYPAVKNHLVQRRSGLFPQVGNLEPARLASGERDIDAVRAEMAGSSRHRSFALHAVRGTQLKQACDSSKT